MGKLGIPINNVAIEAIATEINYDLTGDLIKIPTGLPFGFRHLNRGIGEIRIVSYSDTLPKMLAEIGTLKQNTPPDLEAIAAIAQKYGIEYLN